MPWLQNYDPLNSQFLSTLVAALPIVVLLGLLGSGRVSAHMAAAAGLITAMLAAVFVFHMPVSAAVASAADGAGYGLFPIGLIVVMAIFVGLWLLHVWSALPADSCSKAVALLRRYVFCGAPDGDSVESKTASITASAGTAAKKTRVSVFAAQSATLNPQTAEDDSMVTVSSPLRALSRNKTFGVSSSGRALSQEAALRGEARANRPQQSRGAGPGPSLAPR